MKKLLCALLLTACEPGKVIDNNDDAPYFEWEEGDENPRIASGHVYCEWDPAEFFVFYFNITADDPQGASDIKEGVWRGYLGSQSDTEQPEGFPVEDVLYCDGQECINSFPDHQHAEIPCELIQDFRFEAEVYDWNGNVTDSFNLLVLDGPPED